MPDESDFDHLRRDFERVLADLEHVQAAFDEKDTELAEANAAIRDLASQFSQEKERAESAVADFKELEAALHKMFYLDDEPGDVDCLLEGLETHAKRYDDLVETSSKHAMLIEAIDTACGWGGGSSFETAIQGVAMLGEARKVADDRDGMRLRLEHAEGQASKLGHERDELADKHAMLIEAIDTACGWGGGSSFETAIQGVAMLDEARKVAEGQASKLGHERDELADAIDGAWRLAFAGLEWPHSDEENECVVAVRTIAEELVAAREELSKESAFRLETKAHAQSLEDLLSRKDQEISGLEARQKINSGDYEASRLSSIIVDQAEQIMVLRKGVDDATS